MFMPTGTRHISVPMSGMIRILSLASRELIRMNFRLVPEPINHVDNVSGAA